MSKISQVADPIHGSIQISNIEKKVISKHAFNRLHDVLQNSTAYFTFPSNQTKRFSHSLGTMHLAGQMFYYSFVNAENETRDMFMKALEKDINKILKEPPNQRILRGILGKKASIIDNKEYLKFTVDDSFYNDKIPYQLNETEQFIYVILYQAVRCAALLHDIGHPPFSHITEYALVDIFKNIQTLTNMNKTQKNFYDIMIDYYDESKQKIDLHEKIGNKVASRLLENLENDLSDDTEAKEKLFYFLTNQITNKILCSDENDKMENFFGDIHQIISGSVDADRLDYVTRDLINSGFNKGLIEFDRILSSMKLLLDVDTRTGLKKYRFCFDIRSINTIEDFFRRRWDLYKYLVYHHRVRKTDSILQKIIVKMAIEYLNQDKDQDQDEICLPMNISGVWKAISIATGDKEYFNSLIQWNDSWLMSILRYEYFSNNKDEELNLYLEEFLSNRKQYTSLIKRGKDFTNIEIEIYNQISENADIISIFKEMLDFERVNKAAKGEIKNILELIDVTLSENDLHKYTEKGFSINNFSKLMVALSKPYNELLNSSIESAVKNLKLKSYIIKFNELKTGIKNVFLHEGDEIVLLKDSSRILIELKLDEVVYPKFYLFVAGEDIKKDIILKEISIQFVENLSLELKNIQKEFA